MTTNPEDNLFQIILDDFKNKKGDIEAEAMVLDPFKSEIELIQDHSIRSFVKLVLLNLHEKDSSYKAFDAAFWIAPVGHLMEPGHLLDEYMTGGIVRHTKRVTRTCIIMASSIGITDTDLDILIAAALLHDITKSAFVDDELNIAYDPMHMCTVGQMIDDILGETFSNSSAATLDIEENFMKLISAILRLMRCSHGINAPIPELIPISELEKILAMSDALCTRLEAIIDVDIDCDPEGDDDGDTEPDLT